MCLLSIVVSSFKESSSVYTPSLNTLKTSINFQWHILLCTWMDTFNDSWVTESRCPGRVTLYCVVQWVDLSLYTELRMEWQVLFKRQLHHNELTDRACIQMYDDTLCWYGDICVFDLVGCGEEDYLSFTNYNCMYMYSVSPTEPIRWHLESGCHDNSWGNSYAQEKVTNYITVWNINIGNISTVNFTTAGEIPTVCAQ